VRPNYYSFKWNESEGLFEASGLTVCPS